MSDWVVKHAGMRREGPYLCGEVEPPNPGGGAPMPRMDSTVSSIFNWLAWQKTKGGKRSWKTLPFGPFVLCACVYRSSLPDPLISQHAHHHNAITVANPTTSLSSPGIPLLPIIPMYNMSIANWEGGPTIIAKNNGDILPHQNTVCASSLSISTSTWEVFPPSSSSQ